MSKLVTEDTDLLVPQRIIQRYGEIEGQGIVRQVQKQGVGLVGKWYLVRVSLGRVGDRAMLSRHLVGIEAIQIVSIKVTARSQAGRYTSLFMPRIRVLGGSESHKHSLSRHYR